jgi:hypothetical protein
LILEEITDTSVGRIKIAGLRIRNLTGKPYKSECDTILFEAEIIYILYSIL